MASETLAYPKRLIEVDLPIRKISDHARREKSIRHGHISTLHIWWARRPLAACRAVLCAALWPDPVDPLCPPSFISTAQEQMDQFWNAIDTGNYHLDDPLEVRRALLDFIGDFADWDHTIDERYLTTARALTEAAHIALGGEPGTRPLVVDPFAGGGSIPLEALRVGADAFASDLNPVAVLLNKVVLEYIPKYGNNLADEVRKWGQWVKEEAEKELAEFYPKDPDGATPIAYLWARTITCENPSCGAEVPLIRSLWLAKKTGRSVALKLTPNSAEKKVDFEIIENPNTREVKEGTVARGSATCPLCGYTTPVKSVRAQLKKRYGGAADARMFCVITTRANVLGKFYRIPSQRDLDVVFEASKELERRKRDWKGEPDIVPNEPLPIMSGVFNAPLYGHNTWGSLFCPRQLLTMVTLVGIIRKLRESINEKSDFNTAILTCLAFSVDRTANQFTALSKWHNGREVVDGVFSRQAIPMIWDFGEISFISGDGSYLDNALNWILLNFEKGKYSSTDSIYQADASNFILPDDSTDAFVTDPPYYNAVPYADLSDFFYIWLKRMLKETYPLLFSGELSPKKDEICEMKGWDPIRYSKKDNKWFETKMQKAMDEGRRILKPTGIGTIVFAHKSTSGWESQLQAMIQAGWTITGSWPIDTELENRVRAMNSAALVSSIHLVCRPRESPEGSLRTEDVGDWSIVLKELPPRIHEWMARLSSENVVGADAIFACLGPALEIYSRYSRVEKVSGEIVSLGEYLEHVWAVVSREALATIFKEADTEGFEADARLTAIWLWTISTGNGENGNGEGTKSIGYTLEYDTARKLAQGLGAHPEQMPSIVEVKGSVARLLPVRERTEYLFAKTARATPQKVKAKGHQLTLDGDSIEGTYIAESIAEPTSLDFAGNTILDRIHYSMLLFATGRGDALGRFLKEDIGREPRFAKLAQALSALYPAHSEEKRWVDGVLARKKSLGL